MGSIHSCYFWRSQIPLVTFEVIDNIPEFGHSRTCRLKRVKLALRCVATALSSDFPKVGLLPTYLVRHLFLDFGFFCLEHCLMHSLYCEIDGKYLFELDERRSFGLADAGFATDITGGEKDGISDLRVVSCCALEQDGGRFIRS